MPSDLTAFTGAHLVILSGVGGSLAYDLELSLSRNGERFDLYSDALRGSVPATTGEFSEIDLSPMIAAIPALSPGVDYVALSATIPGQVRTVGLRFTYEAASGPLLIAGDVAGPGTAGGALGNRSDPFLPEHHVAVIENTRATTTRT